MADLNLWETDTTSDEFVQKVTALPDAARVFFQVVDPNNAKKGITHGITGADLKAAFKNVQRPVSTFAAAAVSLDGTEQEIATVTITPTKQTSLIKIEFNATLVGDRNTGGVENAHIDLKVYRDTTLIRTENYEFFTHVTSQTQRQQSVILMVDTPNTKQSVRYKVTATSGSSLENTATFNRSFICTEFL